MAASLRSVLWRAKLFNQGHTGFATFVCLNGRSQSLNGKHSFSIIVESKIKQIEQQKSVADDVYRCKTIAQRYSTASETERNCWKCGVSNRSYEELFFCKCGIVQRLPDDITYFEMLNSAQQFDIDTGHLSQVYKDLQTRLHPDRFTLKSQVEQDLALKQSAFINKAYSTLLKPLTRGLYLLELWGDPLEESSTTLDQEFLLEIMEVNEEVDEARSDQTELKAIEDINNAKIEDCLKEVSKRFRSHEISEAKVNLIKLKYLTNISDKIKDIYRSHMDS